MAPADIMAGLSRTGLALVDGVSSAAQLVGLTRSLGATVVPHRDSGPGGVTVVEDRGARTAALAGFTRSPLSPHTDRSGTACPPDLLLTACGQAATSGGEALLVDGRAVYRDLVQNAPDALRGLAPPPGQLSSAAPTASSAPCSHQRAASSLSGFGSTRWRASVQQRHRTSSRCGRSSGGTPAPCRCAPASGTCSTTAGGCTAAGPTTDRGSYSECSHPLGPARSPAASPKSMPTRPRIPTGSPRPADREHGPEPHRSRGSHCHRSRHPVRGRAA
jgi:hypothetical protein